MTLNAQVTTDDDRPTSHVEIGETKLNGRLEKGDVVTVQFDGGKQVHFRADPVPDGAIPSPGKPAIGQKVRVNARLAEQLLPPVTGAQFKAKSGSVDRIRTANRVRIDPLGNDPDTLAELLVGQGALLH
ncbi:MAG: hypothetical protein J07HB67_00463, partial [halophilic archaeon J07HB67]